MSAGRPRLSCSRHSSSSSSRVRASSRSKSHFASKRISDMNVEDPVLRQRYSFQRGTDGDGGAVLHVETWVDALATGGSPARP